MLKVEKNWVTTIDLQEKKRNDILKSHPNCQMAQVKNIFSLLFNYSTYLIPSKYISPSVEEIFS